ncbi:hypothetical protein GQ43DRAFT_290243 [Delitschia confertaspora ATCC 74209]|uniref:Uncharacterized protein n=1 Tax=Delitschia confertaspora ATCC 74209 TaxID=1513339 RepID=A0A9P4JP70_9PLEO|nr:hypothetical protein GQ43DRAFT_290243 [Delitschia confertaspora ATCC 74209]
MAYNPPQQKKPHGGGYNPSNINVPYSTARPFASKYHQPSQYTGGLDPTRPTAIISRPSTQNYSQSYHPYATNQARRRPVPHSGGFNPANPVIQSSGWGQQQQFPNSPQLAQAPVQQKGYQYQYQRSIRI